MLEIRDLHRSFGETRALQGANLTVTGGEIHALAGENGSGKSTLIKILSGVLRPEAGEVRWDGAPLTATSPAAAQQTGIVTVFQETLRRAGALRARERLHRHRRAVPLRAPPGRRGAGGARRADRHRRRRHRRRAARSGRSRWRSASWSRSPAPSCGRGGSWCSTRAPPPWTRATASACSRTSARRAAPGAPSCSRRTAWTSCVQLADRVTVLRLGATVAEGPMAATSPREILVQMAGKPAAERALEAPAANGSARRQRGEPRRGRAGGDRRAAPRRAPRRSR